jgi:hypothetical protein
LMRGGGQELVPAPGSFGRCLTSTRHPVLDTGFGLATCRRLRPFWYSVPGIARIAGIPKYGVPGISVVTSKLLHLIVVGVDAGCSGIAIVSQDSKVPSEVSWIFLVLYRFTTCMFAIILNDVSKRRLCAHPAQACRFVKL